MPFHDICGQDHAKDFLRRMIRHGRVAHALLFTGPEGVGKRTTAVVMAQALNCLAGQAGEACGECLACQKIAHGTHPDVTVVEPDGQSIKIEQVRERLQHDAVLKPLEGRCKVYLVDQAERLTLEAANSLLKLLEEPPPSVLLVLVTGQPFALLETIRSRCQEVRFHPVAPHTLAGWVEGRLNVPLAEAQALARLSDGRPAEALRMADPEVQALRREVLEWVQSAGPDNWTELARRLGERRSELPEALMLMHAWYRDLLLRSQNAPLELMNNCDSMEALDTAFRTGRSTAEWAACCEAVLEASDQLKRNVNPQLVLEVMWMTLGQRAVPLEQSA